DRRHVPVAVPRHDGRHPRRVEIETGSSDVGTRNTPQGLRMNALLLSLALLFIVPGHQPVASLPAQAAAPAEGRTLRHSGVVNTSVDELWKAFTTAEGWTSAIGVAK